MITARRFNGSSDNLILSPGAAGIVTDAITIVAVVKLYDAGDGILYWAGYRGTGNDRHSLETGGGFYSFYTGTGAGSPAVDMLVASTADNWHMIAVAKAAGTVAPRAHKYVYGTGVHTHASAGSTLAPPNAPTSGLTIQVGQYDNSASEFVNADIAAIGVFSQALTDAQVETLPFSLWRWTLYDLEGLWVFDQDSTAQKVMDLTGKGANEVSHVGTTIVRGEPRQFEGRFPERLRTGAPELALGAGEMHMAGMGGRLM